MFYFIKTTFIIIPELNIIKIIRIANIQIGKYSINWNEYIYSLYT